MGTGDGDGVRPTPNEVSGKPGSRSRRRDRPYRYPTLERTSVDGRLAFTAPSHPSLRGWVLDHGSLKTLHSLIVSALGKRECPAYDVISRIPQFAHSNETDVRPAVPLRQVLELVERLTISTSPFSPPAASIVGPLHYGALRVTGEPEDRWGKWNQYVYRAAADDFRQQWIAWCLGPLDRDEHFLHDYQELLRNLADLAALGRPIRYVLQETVGSGGALTLGAWSCQLPANWKARCSWQTSPSDWAEFLSAIKYGTHTRAIKERLTEANLAQTVREAWARYGAWLRNEPTAVDDLQRRLDGLRIDLPGDASPESDTPR
jgi:hypothetical protein